MIPLKYSCEEVYERMDNGLCIFCDELDTPNHHNLKHKGIRIVIVEPEDDLASDDIEEFHQIQKDAKNPDPFVETVKNLDPLIEPLECASVLQVLDSISEALMVHKVDSYVNEVEESPQQSMNGNGKNIAHQVFDQMPLRVTLENWDSKELRNFDRKRSNKTLYIEEDEHEQNEVRKLISSWDNRVWEPGRVFNEHDKLKWLEKCCKYGTLMRLMQQLFSMWWQGIKSKELDMLAACSFVDLKTRQELCSYEYEMHMLLLGYYGLEALVLSGFKEMCVLSKNDTHIVLFWKQLESFLWLVYGKKLLDPSQKIQPKLIYNEEKDWLRNIEAGSTKMFKKLLVFLGVHNKNFGLLTLPRIF